ncbi:gas vesicle protein GvpO [Actinomycetospora sp. NBC_00405]|uniref:gas vesicle protein GvpO n=1 Tax=Actinomycetospora sp. NBC_00405 TaxID=2975952 RepID=UPI002E1A9F53
MALSRERVHAVSRTALAEVAELTGKDVEKVVALRRDGEVWVLDVEVVDLRRVPESTDFMATYRVHLDDADNVLELRRVRRYVRAWVGDDR